MQTEPGAGSTENAVNPYTHPTQNVAEPDTARSEEKERALAIIMTHVLRGANWFYWIAGLSLVNIGAVMFGMNFRFLIGLGFSEMLGELAKDAEAIPGGSTSAFLYFAIGISLAGFFGACGWFARRPSSVAFITGTIVFALDTIIFVLAQDWIGVAFHAWAIYALWRGFVATNQWKAVAAS